MKLLSRFDRLALLFCLLAFITTAWISRSVFENLPHLEDEYAYVWQADLIAFDHELKITSPACPSCFLVPFVVDYQGDRFGKYPPGWPVVLAMGIAVGARDLVNPFLAAVSLWLIYQLGKKLLGSWVGLMAALLTLTSPFFLMNSSVLLSHPLSLFLSLTFSLAWLDTFPIITKQPEPIVKEKKKKIPQGLTASVAGLSLGLLILTRPLTALGVGLPFIIHGLWLFWHGQAQTRRILIVIGGIPLLFCGIFFLWQFALTGNLLLDPYTLWWPYDKIGYGKGFGDTVSGNNIPQILSNIFYSLKSGASDLFGWGMFSAIFVPFGLWSIRRHSRTWLVCAIPLSLIIVYTSYWIGSTLFGPRYYYEGLPAFAILSAAGIAWLLGIPFSDQKETTYHFSIPNFNKLPLSESSWKGIRAIIVLTVLGVFISSSIIFYDPVRIGGLKNLYEVSQTPIDTFLTLHSQNKTPALVIVTTSSTWISYGVLLNLETPDLSSPYIFIINSGKSLNQQVIDAFPNRSVIYYSPGY